MRKSVGAETTFARDLTRWDEAEAAMAPLCEKVRAACERAGNSGRTVTVKVKYADFRQITRSRSVPDAVASRDNLLQVCLELLGPCFPPALPIRLLGVSVSNLVGHEAPVRTQLTFGLDR